MGGGELAREFLKADLIDKLYLGIVPVLVGEGIPLFPSGFPQRSFSLVENKTYSRGLIALKYRRVRSREKNVRTDSQLGGLRRPAGQTDLLSAAALRRLADVLFRPTRLGLRAGGADSGSAENSGGPGPQGAPG
jgi:hypothetical protein